MESAAVYTYNLGIKFEAIVEQFSKKAALKFAAGNTVSFRELNNKANQLARHLRSNGLSAKDVVCISGEKNLYTFASMIACLKIGVIYSILDPESPAERLRKIVNTCEPRALLIERGLGEELAQLCREHDFKVIANESNALEDMIKDLKTSNLSETREVCGENPAYIMFTSGSTGFPKGALITHDNVLNFIEWSVETFEFTPDDTLTNVNPVYFDNSVFDFYSSIFSGASLAPFTKKTVTDPMALITQIEELGCTSWFSVPSLLIYLQTMKALRRDTMQSIRRFIFGGEGYPKGKLKGLYDLYSKRSQLINVYGPTECTCMCSAYRITESDFDTLVGFPPLGKIADNFSFLLLDKDGQQVLEDTVGELCLMGPNVGKGYYNDPERTAQNFIQNPYNKKYAEIIYKTGDLVSLKTEDGKIHILGRKDHQIKHMGYRIELEEIENALCSLKYVSQAAVIHGELRGLSHIIAVVCASEEKHEKEIRDDLNKIIPHYMIPTNFHFECMLPKNRNGKIDRKKLTEKYFSLNK